MLDLRRLRYFLAIAESGSLSAAARSLNIAQPALSYHLAEMESILGLTLFQRGRHGARLTEDGKLLRGLASEVVSRADRLEDIMARRAKRMDVPVQVRLAIISSLSASSRPCLPTGSGKTADQGLLSCRSLRLERAKSKSV